MSFFRCHCLLHLKEGLRPYKFSVQQEGVPAPTIEPNELQLYIEGGTGYELERAFRAAAINGAMKIMHLGWHARSLFRSSPDPRLKAALAVVDQAYTLAKGPGGMFESSDSHSYMINRHIETGWAPMIEAT